jgi:UrcA family protein
MKITTERQAKSLASIIAVALVATSAGMQVQAAEPIGAPTKVVSYGDLNLNSAKGVIALYGRLRSAAREVCTSLEGRDLNAKALWRNCYENAVAGAVKKIDLPAMTALYAKSTGHATPVDKG